MWGNLSYLLSTVIFTGIPVLFEFIFGYHLFKPHFKVIARVVFVFLIITPFIEKVAIDLNAWQFNEQKNLGIIILRSPLETLIVAFFISAAVSLAVYAWTFYEDKGKPIIRTSLYDVLHGTYAIWKKEKGKKS